MTPALHRVAPILPQPAFHVEWRKGVWTGYPVPGVVARQKRILSRRPEPTAHTSLRREMRMAKPRYYFPGERDTADLDFSTLGFDYVACPYRFEAIFEHGVWRVRGIVEDNTMHLPEGSQCLHYGQQLFEGMKVQRATDGKVYAFRPTDNSRRLNEGARYLKGPEVPEELFMRGIEEVVAANHPYVPPHGSGAAAGGGGDVVELVNGDLALLGWPIEDIGRDFH